MSFCFLFLFLFLLPNLSRERGEEEKLRLMEEVAWCFVAFLREEGEAGVLAVIWGERKNEKMPHQHALIFIRWREAIQITHGFFPNKKMQKRILPDFELYLIYAVAQRKVSFFKKWSHLCNGAPQSFSLLFFDENCRRIWAGGGGGETVAKIALLTSSSSSITTPEKRAKKEKFSLLQPHTIPHFHYLSFFSLSLSPISKVTSREDGFGVGGGGKKHHVHSKFGLEGRKRKGHRHSLSHFWREKEEELSISKGSLCMGKPLYCRLFYKKKIRGTPFETNHLLIQIC